MYSRVWKWAIPAVCKRECTRRAIRKGIQRDRGNLIKVRTSRLTQGDGEGGRASENGRIKKRWTERMKNYINSRISFNKGEDSAISYLEF